LDVYLDFLLLDREFTFSGPYRWEKSLYIWREAYWPV